MILSVSRRTDVPSFHFNWFLNRLREGWLFVRNPFQPSRVSRVPLSPSLVECIVFWSKNPAPMLEKLDALEPWPYYIQYTVNPYGRDMERCLPELSRRLAVFRALAERLGRDRVVWRYSPVVVNDVYTAAYHGAMFGRIAGELAGYTAQCKLSFLDLYAKIRPRMKAMGVTERGDEETLTLARQLNELAARNGIALGACGRPDLRPAGVPATSCVDSELIRRITGKVMSLKKDPGQRDECRCVESVDIGAYHTCLNGCVYCYANHSHAAAARRAAACDPASPFLCGGHRPDDTFTDRKCRVHATGVQEQFVLK